MNLMGMVGLIEGNSESGKLFNFFANGEVSSRRIISLLRLSTLMFNRIIISPWNWRAVENSGVTEEEWKMKSYLKVVHLEFNIPPWIKGSPGGKLFCLWTPPSPVCGNWPGRDDRISDLEGRTEILPNSILFLFPSPDRGTVFKLAVLWLNIWLFAKAIPSQSTSEETLRWTHAQVDVGHSFHFIWIWWPFPIDFSPPSLRTGDHRTFILLSSGQSDWMNEERTEWMCRRLIKNSSAIPGHVMVEWEWQWH